MKAHKIIGGISNNVAKIKWKCILTDCTELAINSHLVQRKGILDQITENGHLIQIKPTSAYYWDKKSPLSFKKLGIKQAVSLKLFCKVHDYKLFKEIEENHDKLGSINSFILFSFRAVCAEIRAKEIGTEINQRTVRSKRLEGKINKQGINQLILGNELGIRDLNLIRLNLANELNDNTNRFKYFAYKNPKINVFASSAMSANAIGFQDVYDFDLHNIYIHIIPQKEYSLMMIGYDINYVNEPMIEYCKTWDCKSLEEYQLKLTNLFAVNISNWGMSPKLFSQISLLQRNKFKSIFINNINSYGIPKNQTFNLFKE